MNARDLLGMLRVPLGGTLLDVELNPVGASPNGICDVGC